MLSSHLVANIRPATAGKGVAHSGSLARPSYGGEVPPWPQKAWSAEVSRPAKVRKVGLVDLAFAGTALMTLGYRKIMAGQAHKMPPGPARRSINLG
jgi:hypothetical protein